MMSLNQSRRNLIKSTSELATSARDELRNDLASLKVKRRELVDAQYQSYLAKMHLALTRPTTSEHTNIMCASKLINYLTAKESVISDLFRALIRCDYLDESHQI
jgi:hypothetical protein